MNTSCPLNFTDPMKCPGGRGIWCSACAPRGMLRELRGEAVTRAAPQTRTQLVASVFEVPLTGDVLCNVAQVRDILKALQ